MPEYRRVLIPGGTFFFTLVTFERIPILTSELSRQILKQVWKTVRDKHPFTCDAICLLPDHLHCIWTLPENDTNYAIRWAAIKALFSKKYLQAGGMEGIRSNSRKEKGEAAIWQRRYWEHCIVDDNDFSKHFDYIHYNPVKHNLVSSVSEWQWSSFHKYKLKGYYPEGWGEKDFDFKIVDGDYGEMLL